jgi:hypothetical protein
MFQALATGSQGGINFRFSRCGMGGWRASNLDTAVGKLGEKNLRFRAAMGSRRRW